MGCHNPSQLCVVKIFLFLFLFSKVELSIEIKMALNNHCFSDNAVWKKNVIYFLRKCRPSAENYLILAAYKFTTYFSHPQTVAFQ